MSVRQLKRTLSFLAFLVAGIMSAFATGAGASAIPDTTAITTPTTTASTMTAPNVAVAWDRLAYKMLFISTYGPTCKTESLACYPPLPNVRVKVYSAQKKLIRSVLTNAKGRVYISFPETQARYSMTVSHAPIDGKRLATRTFGLRLPFFGHDGVSEFKLYYCLGAAYMC